MAKKEEKKEKNKLCEKCMCYPCECDDKDNFPEDDEEAGCSDCISCPGCCRGF